MSAKKTTTIKIERDIADKLIQLKSTVGQTTSDIIRDLINKSED